MKGLITKIFILIFLSAFVVSCNKEVQEENLDTNNTEMSNYNEGDVVAVIKTTNGTINILMETEKAPITTTNFIGLAKQGYYNGVIFHRIIKDFMIQGGDPDGTGMGGTSIYGEKFDDEFAPDLKNNKYTISMANAGKNTNGSQFFINTANNNFLDGKHAVFGRVIEGFENIDKIEKSKTGANDRPVKEVKMISVEIKEYKGGSLKDYDFDLNSTLAKIEEDKKSKSESKKNKIVEKGDNVAIHYTGTFENGEKFDSSLDRGEPIEFQVGAGQMIVGFDEGVEGMKIGDKKNLKLSPEKAYGGAEVVIPKSNLQSFIDAGIKLEAGGVLPTGQGDIKIISADDTSITIENNHPMAGKTLIFDIELVEIK